MPLSRIPKSLKDAIIATEDRRFYSHWGVDPVGIARAVYQNYRRGRIVEGAARSPAAHEGPLLTLTRVSSAVEGGDSA